MPYNQNSHVYRRIVQYFSLITVLFIGTKFIIFVNQIEKGVAPTVTRPPGIEAFIPISSVVSLRYWLASGVLNRIHPSGLIILLLILATAVILKRGFCSWVCPFGLITEYMNSLHDIILKGRLKVPRALDYPLRALKYILLGFFLWSIFIRMDVRSLEYFIYSPYNRIADIKMLHFFTNMSVVSLVVFISLLFFSVLVRNFWCRYLCPYGALLGAMSLLSFFKIHRSKEMCSSCRRCAAACPAGIKVHETICVVSDECHACMKCVIACPQEDALQFSLAKTGIILKPLVYMLIICFLFVGGGVLARVTGHWQNDISTNEYQFLVKHEKVVGF